MMAWLMASCLDEEALAMFAAGMYQWLAVCVPLLADIVSVAKMKMIDASAQRARDMTHA